VTTGQGPGGDQAAEQRRGLEHLDGDAALDHLALDDVEAVQLGARCGEVRQVPPRRRGGPADTAAAVQRHAALEDAADGAHREDRLHAPRLQRGAGDTGAELAQVASVFQLGAEGEHEVLQVL
jgi:hypothetical protein